MTRLQAVRLTGALAAALSAVAFIALAAGVVSGAASPLDNAIRSAVHAQESGDLTAAAFAVSWIGSTPVWLGVTLGAIVIFALLNWRRAAVDLAIVIAGATVLENALKMLFARARPESFFGSLPTSYSFPSGHAVYAGCLYAALACLIGARIHNTATGVVLWICAVTLIGAIGLSRIYLGVHFPSDVAGGYLIAIGWIGAVTAWRGTDAN